MRRHSLVISGLMLAGFWHAGEASWFETRQSVENLAEAGRFAQAIEREEELLTVVEEAFGAPSIELSDAYLLMGSIHSLHAQYFEAEDRILQALQLIEDIEGPISTRLIAPFVALGENYHSSEDYDLALGAYNEARNLGRRGFAVLGHRRNHSGPVRRRSVADAASASGRCRQPAKGPAVAQ